MLAFGIQHLIEDNQQTKNIGFNDFELYNSLEDRVNILYKKAKTDKNTVIILSPVSSSYDKFKNFEMLRKIFKIV